MLDRAQPFRASGRSKNGIAGSRGRQKQVFADTVQSAGIRKQRDLYRANLLRRALAGSRHAHGPVLPDGHRGGIRRNGDSGFHRITIRSHNISLRVEMKRPAAGIRGFPRRQSHLKKSLPAHCYIQRVAGLAEIALGLHDFRCGGPCAQAYLQSRSDRGLLRRGGARHDHVLIKKIFELYAPLSKPRGAGVREIIGDIIQVGFLGAHSARGRVESSQHSPSSSKIRYAAVRPPQCD